MFDEDDVIAFEFVFNALQRTATHCDTLQHTATHCNTPQHRNFLRLMSTHAFLCLMKMTSPLLNVS